MIGLPFSLTFWCVVLLTLILISFCIIFVETMIKRRKKNLQFVNSFFGVFAIVMQQNASFSYNNRAMLLVVISLLFFGLIISSAYSGGLASVLNRNQ